MLLSVATVALTGCKSGNKSTSDDDTTAFEEYLTSKDTLAVQELVNRFLYYVDHGSYTEAAAMLYKHNPDRLDVPEALNNAEMQDIVEMLNGLQPVSHRIDYIKFSETNHNEVRVSLILRESTADVPEVATSLIFNPIDVLDVWYLCLYDLSTDDRSIVDVSDRDSLKDLYIQQVADQSNQVSDKAAQ